MNTSDILGVFDTGLGGLSVLNKLSGINNQIIYYGDNKNSPYGTSAKKEIEELSIKAIKKLYDLNIRNIIIACNTVCCVALEDLKKEFSDVNFINILELTAIKAALLHYSDIAIIGTKATIDSNCYT